MPRGDVQVTLIALFGRLSGRSFRQQSGWGLPASLSGCDAAPLASSRTASFRNPDVDVTTSARHHRIEYLLTAGFYWLVVLVLDIPVVVVMSNTQAVFAAAAVTHGNTNLPEWLECLLQPVLITFDLHLIHHSISYDEANANFWRSLSV
jgi:hypothetical protein